MTGHTLVPGSASEAELSRMMRQYGPMLVGTCALLLGDVHLAQDVVQETFIRAYRSRNGFRGEHEGSERAWLFKIAINLCRDQQRSKWFRFVDRRTPIETLNLPMQEVNDEARQLYAAVQTLPTKYREVVLLHYYQEMSVDDMAAAYHVARSTIYRRLDIAHQLLKKTLERWDSRG